MRGVLLDITESKYAEERLRESEERHAFLLKLSDALSLLSESSDIMAEASRLTGQHLGLDRCGYGEVDAGLNHFVFPGWYVAAGVVPFPTEVDLESFGKEIVADIADGNVVVANDVQSDPELSKPAKEEYARASITAFVGIPLMKGGRLVAILSAHQSLPRDWSEADIGLLRDVLHRTYDAIERARTEKALSRSEQRYRTLFESMDEAYAVVEVLADEDGRWSDFLFLEVNPAFRKHTSMPYPVGKRATELLGSPNPRWAEVYGEVVDAGKAVRIEEEEPRLDRVFDLNIFRLGEPEDRRVAVLFSDVTERKRAEQHQNMLMAELDHRVKNILAVVQSITRQTLGRGRPPAPDAAKNLVGRINALARAHDLLASSRWEGARFKDIVESAVAPYRNGWAHRIVAQGSDLKVTPKAAQTLNLAIHELVTNAAKYGALSHDEGHITAEWHLTKDPDDPHLVVTWQEHGGPLIDKPPVRKGFGSLLIEQMLASELDGDVKLDYARDGLRAVMDLPVRTLRASGHGRQTSRPHPEAARPAGDASSLHGKRILLVEDEYLVANAAREALQAAGCEVAGPISSVAEALRVAVTASLDGAVLDINLAGDRVWPAARALQARRIPFVFATGYSDTIDTPPDLQDAKRIEKPATDETLLATLAASMQPADQG